MRERILNAGCGTDTYGTHFIDIYPQRSEVKKVNVNTQKFPFPTNFFDTVYAECVFEHLQNPAHFLSESHRVLKKNGKIIIVTDNAGFWGLFGMTHHGGYEKNAKSSMNTGEKDRHYALFTPNHLENWLKAFGFKKVEVEYFLDLHKTRSRDFFVINTLAHISKRFTPHLRAVGTK